MDKNQTIEKLKSMRLGAMAELHRHNLQNNLYNDLAPDEYIALLVDHKWEERQSNKNQGLVKQAASRQNASIPGVDFSANRNLDKNRNTCNGALVILKNWQSRMVR